MTLFDLLLDEFNKEYFNPQPLWTHKLNEYKGSGEDYLKYLKYLKDYREKEDAKIKRFLNTKKTDIEKRKDELDGEIFKVNEELRDARAALDKMEMDPEFFVHKVAEGYEHDKVKKMKRTEKDRENDALKCANLMYIFMDLYNHWEKLTKRITDLERKLSRLEKERDSISESLTSIGFYIDEKEDCSPSETE